MKNHSNTVSDKFCIMNIGSKLAVLKIIADQNKLNLRLEHEDVEARNILEKSIKEN